MDNEKTIEELKKEAEEFLNGWKRAKADFANYQKQVEKDRAEWFMYANATCVKAILPVLDSLEMAIHQLVIASPDASVGAKQSQEIATPPAVSRDDIRGGIEKIRDQMLDALKQMGVEAIKAVGEPVDPEFHEVVAVEPSDDVSHGLIAREVQRGYTMHGKVLRVAKVIVSQ